MFKKKKRSNLTKETNKNWRNIDRNLFNLIKLSSFFSLSQNGDVPRSRCSDVERVQGASSTLATASTRYTTSSVAGFEHVRHRVDPAER